ncbi:MAG: signal recognition particle-docking protein FtsY [Nitrospinota bacterium]
MPEKKTFFSRLKKELFKTRKGPISGILQILRSGKVNDSALDEIEETLILSDIGVKTSMEIVNALRRDLKKSGVTSSESILTGMKGKMVGILKEASSALHIPSSLPMVIMVVGVNGSGKTTTIGKLAHRFVQEGKKVLVAAADTFRAGAIQQLDEWSKRSNADIVKSKGEIPPSAVVFDAIHAAKRGYDVLIIDTAGRLQTTTNLMEELKKINKIVSREMPGAPHETLLVIDSTTGQNAISQVTLFNEATPLTGLVLTKLDGTAKGGVVINLVNELKLPVKLIGFGEAIEDLGDFIPEEFVDGLFQTKT